MQGNGVRDGEGNEDLFNELGASPAASVSGKLVDAFGLVPGHSITTADGCQAYTQALPGDRILGLNPDDPDQIAETWVSLPEELRPAW